MILAQLNHQVIEKNTTNTSRLKFFDVLEYNHAEDVCWFLIDNLKQKPCHNTPQ